ncbi:GAF domain-containing protein [Crocosphaera sp. UHCC 0190]|uniref:GAF domain-containing protein n=1 Tax=Crocosphaera sp. UHCC 0190 TaxID=3110246 RepID=UPI002B21FEE1|nr:GAF domain-containing protein [Crocosphaera sp. UHCC 0190]MEA5509246.1 GAF domain-containing protein [Crocosphaera sp. UHCC 0190]
MQMNYDPNFIFRLVGISNLLEEPNNFEDSLQEVANLTAQILKTRRCSIMLLADDEDISRLDSSLRVFIHYGNLPPSAYQEITPLNEGIAGYVAATGKALLIEDIQQSQFASVARFLYDDDNKSLISAPIILSKRVVGVINVSSPLTRKSFNQEDLKLMETFALFVGKSLQISQLQTILRSKFVELAVVRDLVEQEIPETMTIHPNPSKLAKIVAKSFFKELTQAGFTVNQIISIATEVLNLLQEHLARLTRHKKRLERDEMVGEDTD